MGSVCENNGGGYLEGAGLIAVNGAFVKAHLFLFFYTRFFLTFCPFSALPSSPLWLSPLQPSSPGDYYSSVESDLKVELTEKLFALDTEGNSPANTEVCVCAPTSPLLFMHSFVF